MNKINKIEKQLARMEKRIVKQEADITKRIKLLEAKENKIKNKALAKQNKMIKKQNLKAFNTRLKEFNRSIRKEDLKLKRSHTKIDKYFESLKSQGNELGIKLRKEDVQQLFTYSVRFYGEVKIDDDDENVLEYYKRKKDLKYDETGKEYFVIKQINNISIISNPYHLVAKHFYNKTTDGSVFIDDCVKYFKRCEDYTHILDVFESYIDGFYIDVMTVEAIQVAVRPDFQNIKYRDDDDYIGIDNKYTNYSVNSKASNFKDLVQLTFTNDYLRNNYRKRCCFLTAIINKFYSYFNVIKSDGKRAYKELTYDFLCQFLKLQNKPTDIECSINEVLPFFEKYGLGFFIYDIYLNLLYKYEPEVKSSKYQTLRLIAKDNHLFEINDNVKSLQQIIVYNEEEVREIDSLEVSSKYSISKDDDDNQEDEYKIHKINKLEDITEIIKQYINKEKKQVKIKLLTNDTSTILFDMMEKGGFTPSIYYNSDVYKLSFQLDYFTISVEKFDINFPDEPDVSFDSVDMYNRYHKASNEFNKILINNDYISEYHPTTIDIEDKYKIVPCNGYFYDDRKTGVFDAIDENNAYPACLMSMDKVPVFHYFDIYQPYDNHEIEDYTYYFISIESKAKEITILFNEKYSLSYGFVLKDLDSSYYKILQFKRPSTIKDVSFQEAITNLFTNSNITDKKVKKDIANRNIGLLGKIYNQKQLTKTFKNKQHAHYYKYKYNGSYFEIKRPVPDMEDIFKEGMTEEELLQANKDLDEILLGSSPFSFVNVQKKKRLTNGFKPMKDIIYQKQALKLFHMYKKMTSLKMKVYGIKTDCLLYDPKEVNIDKLKKNFTYQTGVIGAYKKETKKFLISTKLSIEKNDLITFPSFNTIVKTFEDEYNTNNINEYLKNNQVIFIKASVPGSGKSQTVKNYDKNTLFVVPYNELGLDLKKEGFDVCTFHSFFSLDIHDKQQNKSKGYNIDGYETICFDEALLHKASKIRLIDRFIRNNPNIKVIGCGDSYQAESIDGETPEYIEGCIDKVFKNQILFNVNKRMETEEDKVKLYELKTDIFENNMEIKDIIKKYNFKTINHMNNLKTVNNICYFNNMTLVRVNNYIHRTLLNNKDDYYEGMILKCRKHTILKAKDVLHTNYVYKVTKIKKDSFTLVNEIDNITHEVTKSIIQSNFKYPYCSTIDSIQGKSMGNEYTIFDLDLSYMSRRRIYTALTRARRFDNITIYLNNDNMVQQFKENRYKQYFKFKIDNYKIQDRKKSRTYTDEDYIDHEFFTNHMKSSMLCKVCSKAFELYLDNDNNVQSNITVDRIDNSLAHIKTNCFLSCIHCNVSRK